MPKSMAPMEMRLAERPVSTIMPKAEQHGKRNGDGGDEGDAQVAEHGEQHQGDQNEAGDDDVADGVGGGSMRLVRS